MKSKGDRKTTGNDKLEYPIDAVMVDSPRTSSVLPHRQVRRRRARTCAKKWNPHETELVSNLM